MSGTFALRAALSNDGSGDKSRDTTMQGIFFSRICLSTASCVFGRKSRKKPISPAPNS